MLDSYWIILTELTEWESSCRPRLGIFRHDVDLDSTSYLQLHWTTSDYTYGYG